MADSNSIKDDVVEVGEKAKNDLLNLWGLIPEEYEHWAKIAVAFIVLLIAIKFSRRILFTLRTMMPRKKVRTQIEVHSEPVYDAIPADELPSGPREQRTSWKGVMASAGNSIKGYDIIESLGAVSVTGYDHQQDAINALKEKVAISGGNGVIHVDRIKGPDKSWGASGESVIIRSN